MQAEENYNHEKKQKQKISTVLSVIKLNLKFRAIVFAAIIGLIAVIASIVVPILICTGVIVCCTKQSEKKF